MNNKGQFIVPFIYDYATDFYQGNSFVLRGETWYLLDKKGNESPLKKDIISIIDNSIKGYVKFKTKTTNGILTKNGELVIETQYKIKEYPKDDFIIITKNDKNGCIDINGKMIIAPQYDGLEYYGYGLFQFTKDKEIIGYLNTKGEVVWSTGLPAYFK